MNWYAHIDFIQPPAYRVRVNALTAEGMNGDELLRFDHTSELRGNKLRAEVEQKAAAMLKEKGIQ